MSFFPTLVGDVEIRRRQPRYNGEPSYKRCSFIRPKSSSSKQEVTYEVIQVPQQGGYTDFFNSPQWHNLPYEQQRRILEQYRRQASQQTQYQTIQPQQLPYHQGQHHGHNGGPLEIEPKYTLIEPKATPKTAKPVRVDRGHDIFDSESDTESRSSKSSHKTSTTKSSKKSSRSSSSSSSNSSFTTIRGW